MHTQRLVLGSAPELLCLISPGLFTPPGNFQTLFSYTYFPVNHMNTLSNQFPGAVSRVWIPETLLRLPAAQQRQFYPWPHSLPAQVAAQSASRAQSLGCIRSIWAPSQDTFKGWGRRFSKKGRAAGEAFFFANRSTFPSRLIIKLYPENMGDLGDECGPHYRKRLTQKGPL